MAPPTPSPPHPPSPYIEIEDLVRLPNARLAFIERIAGDSSDEEDEDATIAPSDVESTSSGGSVADDRGRLIRWVPGAPSATAHQRRKAPSGNVLISTYDDEDDLSDHDEPPPTPIPPPTHVSSRTELAEGTALVSLVATGERIVAQTNTLVTLDRNFDPGQLVIRAAEASSNPRNGPLQSGVVESVSKVVQVRGLSSITPATVESPSPDTVFEVPSERLAFFTGIRAGDTVVRGAWVGVIDHFQEEVYVGFPDGAIACVPGHRKALRNVDWRTPDPVVADPFAEGLYYPGQCVRSLPHVWRNIATWIRGAYTGIDEGVVKSVRVGEVGVEWVAKSMYAADGEDDPFGPDAHQRGVQLVRFEDITLLESFRHLWWSSWDRGILLPEESSTSAAMSNGNYLGAQSFPGISVPDEQGGDDDDDRWTEDEDDGEWEEEHPEEEHNIEYITDSTTDVAVTPSAAGPSSTRDVPPRLSTKNRSKRPPGRLSLMKAQRKARERASANGHVGTVSEAALASTDATPEDVVQVVGTTSRVTVLWQDGTRSENELALNLRVNNHPDPYDFWPGEIVFKVDDELEAERMNEDQQTNGGPSVTHAEHRKGALVRVNQSERTAVVRWQNKDGTGFDEEEEVSVYELKTDDYEVGIGDTVLHVPKNSAPSERPKEWVGVITKQHQGQCTVVWYGGKVSSVPVKDLLYISGGDDDSYDETGMSSSDGESESRELRVAFYREHSADVDGGEIAYPDEPAYHHNWGSDDEGEKRHSGSESLFGKGTIVKLLTSSDMGRLLTDVEERDVDPAIEKAIAATRAELEAKRLGADGQPHRRRVSKLEERVVAGRLTFQILSEIYSTMLGRTNLETERPRERTSFRAPIEPIVNRTVEAYEKMMKAEMKWLAEEMNDSVTNSGDVVMEGSPERGAGASDAATNGAVVEHEVLDEGESGSHEEEGPELERFEMVEELKSFHAFEEVGSSASISAGFLSVVRKEWNRLRKNLPEGVIVRASERDCEKLRAGIIGPQGTPYADVIFFFDIRLGSTYPMTPPHVWFRSHGRRLNPNLYENGKVCLSILGTWDGDDVECWDAKTSNLLRVLLSLQGLVFVEEPYYNEAGYSRQRGTEEGGMNSRMYNESAFLLCMRHIIYSLRVGGVPEDCADVAALHYGRVGKRILERCHRLAEGREKGMESSAGFRKSLEQLLGRLEAALGRVCGKD